MRIGARDFVELVLLSILWGAAYLFMRSAVPAFGAAPMIAIRLAIAAAVLFPLVVWQGQLGIVRKRFVPLLVLAIPFTALAFLLLGLAARSLPAGPLAILNATSPLWAAIVGHLWLKDRIGGLRALGLVVGFAGVVVLVWGKVSFGEGGSALGIACVLGSSILWGVGGNFTKRHLSDVPPAAMSVASLAMGAVVLAPLAWLHWPDNPPPLRAWLEVAFLGVMSSGVGFLMYFRLLRRIGPVGAISVTFLNPLVSMVSGALYLGEAVTLQMLAGCAVIIAGTALTLGLVGPRLAPVPARPATPAKPAGPTTTGGGS